MIEHIENVMFQDDGIHADVLMLDGHVGKLRLYRKPMEHIVGQLTLSSGTKLLNSIQVHQIIKGMSSWNGLLYEREHPFYGLLNLRIPKNIDIWLYSQQPQANPKVHLIYKDENTIEWCVTTDDGATSFQMHYFDQKECLLRKSSQTLENADFARIAYALRHHQDLLIHYEKGLLHLDELEDIVEVWNTASADDRASLLRCRHEIDARYPLKSAPLSETALWLS